MKVSQRMTKLVSRHTTSRPASHNTGRQRRQERDAAVTSAAALADDCSICVNIVVAH